VELERASGTHHDLWLVPDDSGLASSLRGAASSLVIVDPYSRNHVRMSHVWWCLRNVSRVGVILYGDFQARPAQDVAEMARLGIRWFVTLNVDDHPLALRRLLLRAVNDGTVERFREQLRDLLPPRCCEIVEVTLEACVAPLAVCDLASRFNVSERQFHRRMRRLGLPSPGALIRWCRVLHAVRLMDDADRSLNQAARLLEFSDPANLRRLIKSTTSRSPSQILDSGGLIAVQIAFMNRISPLHSRPASADVSC